MTTQTTGRRKQAVARVRLTPGTGEITANGRAFDDYFPSAVHRRLITEPLRVSDAEEQYDIDVTLDGGGLSGQAGAFRLGIARALVELDLERRPAIKAEGLLTRDPRKKESKKYGLKKARKAPQYSKR
ncbi:MAG: 30S ribosomal protein S9 [Acidimicrobiales bacterium]